MARLQVCIPDPLSNMVGGFGPFLDHSRTLDVGFARRMVVSGTTYVGEDIYTHGWVDADYDFVNPLPAGASQLQIYFYLSPQSLDLFPDFSAKTMKMTWTGGGGVTSISGLVGNIAYDLVARTCIFNYSGPATSNSGIYFNVTSGGEPPRGIKIFDSAHEALVTSGKLLDPDWVAALSPWAALRCLDLTIGNGNEAVNYSDFPLPSFAAWNSNSITNGNKSGVPIAVLIELANLANRPIWFNIPHKLTDAAVTALATALRDGITSTCRPQVILEYSNEYWNDAFPQWSWMNTQAASVGWTGGDSQQWGGYRHAQMMGIFRSVYGSDSGQGNRFAGVMATQLVNTDIANRRIIGANHYITNEAPAGTTLQKLFSYYAPAMYFGPFFSTALSGIGQTALGWANTSQATFNTNMFNALKAGAGSNGNYSNIDFCLSYLPANKTIADANNWAMVLYEGGNETQCALPLRDGNAPENTTNANILNNACAMFAASQECADLEVQLADGAIAGGCIWSSKFEVFGPHTRYGSWGMRQTSGDNNPTYQELTAWNKNNEADPYSYLLDNGLSALDGADKVVLCSQKPTTYLEANATYALADYSGGSIFATIADLLPSSRKRDFLSQSGSILGSANGNATHWAALDTVNSRLLIAGPLATPIAVSNGNSYSLSNGYVAADIE